MKIEELRTKINEGFRLSFSRLLDEKKRAGNKLVVMLDSKVVELSVDEYIKRKDEGRI